MAAAALSPAEFERVHAANARIGLTTLGCDCKGCERLRDLAKEALGPRPFAARSLSGRSAA